MAKRYTPTSASKGTDVDTLSGGGTYGSGTLAARPVSPAAGDTYAVTSGAAKGDRYTCFVAGAWTLSRFDLIGGFTPTMRWKLDETSGTTAANSGSATSANLTYSGTPKLGGFVGPRSLRGASFLGDTQYAGGYGVTPTSSTAFSTFGLVDIASLTGGFQPLIVRRVSPAGEPYTWYLGFIDDALTMYYRTVASGSFLTLTASSGYIPAGVHTIGAVWNAGTLKLYLDAVEVGSASPGSTLLWASAGSPTWRIGSTGTAGEKLNGKAAEVHVYDGTALTAAEVLELHGRMLGTYEGA